MLRGGRKEKVAEWDLNPKGTWSPQHSQAVWILLRWEKVLFSDWVRYYLLTC